MSSERPTIRPVTLSRLVEAAFLAHGDTVTTTGFEKTLDVTNRRARETILEAERISLIEEVDQENNEQRYAATGVGTEFVTAVEDENWSRVTKILRTRSPHYGSFIDVVDKSGPITPDDALSKLNERSEHTPHDYNETSLDIVGDWAQRLGVIQRNAFSGTFYLVDRETVTATFPYQLVTTIDELEETAGVNMRQRYLSIPELREELCEQLGCTRSAFDEALVKLAKQNIGKLELSGAPIDTVAKNARFGIKSITYADADDIVTTEQSSEQIMSGVEMLGKKYYYLAVHDENLQFEKQ